MRFILLVGHGSREEQGNEEIRNFAKNLVNKKNLANAEVCFLEFGSPDISTGIENCVEKGATEIIVIPVILLPAGHSKLHIPSALDVARIKYPHIKFKYATPVGCDPRILDILDDRIKSVKEAKLPEHTAILLVGRGSSDPDANSQLFRTARLLWERRRFQMVETAFMGITEPLIDAGIQRCISLGATNILILPFFLFTGILMDRMKKLASDFSQKKSDLRIDIADYFGFHPLLMEIIETRIKEALSNESKLNCDFCQYRIPADESDHHDHGYSHDHDHGHHKHHH